MNIIKKTWSWHELVYTAPGLKWIITWLQLSYVMHANLNSELSTLMLLLTYFPTYYLSVAHNVLKE